MEPSSNENLFDRDWLADPIVEKIVAKIPSIDLADSATIEFAM